MQQPLFRSLLAAALCAAAVPAQTDYEVRLEPKSRVVAAGADIKIQLVIDVKKDAQVPRVLLSGLRLEAKVGGNSVDIIDDAFGDAVKLTEGTRVQRVLTIPAARLNVPPGQDLADVTIGWKGTASASTVVKVAPDVSNIALEDLDLAKTKVLLLTNKGQMVVRFFPDKAPKHVANFIKLSKSGFYDGTKFHRVIKDFMIQGGCPNTKEGASGMPGTGNPGWTVDAEFNDTKHVRGILSMARSGHPNSAGSQFFVLHGTAPHLDNQYSAFGVLDSGLDTLDRLAETQVKPSERGEPSVPVEPLHLHNAIVLPVLKAK